MLNFIILYRNGFVAKLLRTKHRGDDKFERYCQWNERYNERNPSTFEDDNDVGLLQWQHVISWHSTHLHNNTGHNASLHWELWIEHNQQSIKRWGIKSGVVAQWKFIQFIIDDCLLWTRRFWWLLQWHPQRARVQWNSNHLSRGNRPSKNETFMMKE